MEIKASAIYDYKTTKALTYLSIYKQKNPTKTFVLWMIYFSIMTLITFAYQLKFSGPAILWFLIVVFVILSFLMVLMHFVQPKRAYRGQGKFADAEISYIFKEDEMSVAILAKASGEKNDENDNGYKGESIAKYSMIYKVMETNTYLFIFSTKDSAYVVDKSTFKDGELEKLREVLEPLFGKKYIVCKH